MNICVGNISRTGSITIIRKQGRMPRKGSPPFFYTPFGGLSRPCGPAIQKESPMPAVLLLLDHDPQQPISSFRNGRQQFRALWLADVRAAKRELPICNKNLGSDTFGIGCFALVF
jgi:hypothetical protein